MGMAKFTGKMDVLEFQLADTQIKLQSIQKTAWTQLMVSCAAISSLGLTASASFESAGGKGLRHFIRFTESWRREGPGVNVPQDCLHLLLPHFIIIQKHTSKINLTNIQETVKLSCQGLSRIFRGKITCILHHTSK